MGWSAGLAGIAGGVFWLAHNAHLSLNEVEPAVAENKVAEPTSAVPGLTASTNVAAVTHASENNAETRLRRLEVQIQTFGQQLQTQQQRLDRSREELARLTQALERQQLDSQILNRDQFSLAKEPPSPQAEQAEAQERLALLDRQLVSEGIDHRWSGPATEQIQAVLAAGTLGGSALSSVRCQTTVCRVEVDSRDSEALDLFLGEFPVRLGWSANSYSQVTTHEDGSVTVVLYISREGYRLPRPDA
jgi:hypothetical protein